MAVSGRIQTRSYDGNDGQKRYVTEVVADDASIIDWDNGNQNSAQASDGEMLQGYTPEDYNDEVPF